MGLSGCCILGDSVEPSVVVIVDFPGADLTWIIAASQVTALMSQPWGLQSHHLINKQSMQTGAPCNLLIFMSLRCFSFDPCVNKNVSFYNSSPPKPQWLSTIEVTAHSHEVQSRFGIY